MSLSLYHTIKKNIMTNLQILTIKESDLKNGIRFNFSNEQHCEDTFSDDIRMGLISFNKRFNWFTIEFNGTCIHCSKTFKSSISRLEKLMDKWSCQLTEIENLND